MSAKLHADSIPGFQGITLVVSPLRQSTECFIHVHFQSDQRF